MNRPPALHRLLRHAAVFATLAALLLASRVRADIVMCDNWSVNNGNRNTPLGTQFFGRASTHNDYNDPMAVTMLPQSTHSYAGLAFPGPAGALDYLYVEFGLDFHGGDGADGLSFNFAPWDPNTLDERGNINGLNVQFIIDLHSGAQNYGQMNIYYKGQLKYNYNFPDSFSLWRRANNLAGNCRPPIQFSMTVTPDGNLNFLLQIRTTTTCDFVGHVTETVPLGTANPLSDPNWQPYFGARSGNGSVWCMLDAIDIRGTYVPKLDPAPGPQTANQDQTSAPVSLQITSLDSALPSEGAVVEVHAADLNLIPDGNIRLTQSGAIRTLTFAGARGASGNTVLNVSVSYPGVTQTNQYTIPVTIVKNVPPTVSLPSELTLPQGRTLSVPLSYGSEHWNLFPSVTVVAAEDASTGGPLIQNGAVGLLFPSIPAAPGTVDGYLNLTPRLDRTGNTAITVTVTDGSGDQASSKMTVHVVDPPNEPVVAGQRTAFSFNEDSNTGQRGVDYVLTGDLGSNFTIEAWVWPSELEDRAFNPIVSLGSAATAGYAMLALQANGMPSFAGNMNDAIPTTGAAAPRNFWTHVAVAVQGQNATFYVNGEQTASQVLGQAMNVQSGQLAVGSDLINGTFFHGRIDEVRVWNLTRSPDQIRAAWRAKVPATSPGLIRYYDFDEGFFHFIFPDIFSSMDRTGHSEHGVSLSGFPSYVPGAALAVPIAAPEGQPLHVPLVAANVQGTNAYGYAGAVQEIYLYNGSDGQGRGVQDLLNSHDYPANPYIINLLGDSVEVPPKSMTYAGQRLRGYLLPPQTGNYTLWIAANTEAQLWVSSDDQPAHLAQVASSPDTGVGFRQWNANASQKSAPLLLVASHRYYFEVLHQTYTLGIADYHVSVQWQMPDGTLESPLPAHRVQPAGPIPQGALQITLVEPPAYGQVEIRDGTLVYTPTPYFYGLDDLSYYVVEAGRTSAVAQLVLQVTNTVNRPTAGTGTALYLADGGAVTDGSLSLSNRTFTVEAWAMRPDPLSRGWILSQGTASTNQGLVFGWESSDNNSHFTFGFWGDDLVAGAQFHDTNWHHWAGTFDATTRTRQIFMDGVLIAQDVAADVLRTRGDALLYFATQFGGAPAIDLGLSEVRIWDHVRTTQELQANLHVPLSGQEEGLMLYYRFNEANGLVAHDSSAAPPYATDLPAVIAGGGIAWLTNTTHFGQVTVERNLGQFYPPNKIYLPAFSPGGLQLTYFLVGTAQNGYANIPDYTQPYIEYTPNLRAKGTDSLRYFVQDSSGAVSYTNTIAIAIATRNLPPSISSFLDQGVEEEDPPLTLSFVIGDIDLPASSLRVSGTCSNPNILPPESIRFGGSDANRTVTLSPVDGEVGSGTVTITVSDGELTTSTQFTFEVKGRLIFSPVDLGLLTGQPHSEANDINSAGQVVGLTAADDQGSHPGGFFYTGFGALADQLPTATLGGDGSALNGINAAGQVAGWSVPGSPATNVIVAIPAQDTT
ncbi:MAG: hypothetical protein KIT22_03315 [Verrucomicrobiae bacterium]|nr:hypothetical protein [Verrucomicrobiae bacterium]